MRALIDALVTRKSDRQRADAQIGALVADYGAAEVERMLERIERQLQRPRDPDAEKPGSPPSICGSTAVSAAHDRS